MELQKEQYEQIKDCFSKQRKPAKISNLEVLNAVLYVVENGCFEKRGPQSIGRTRGGWNTKLHMVAASDRDRATFSLSAGNCGDGPEGRVLLQQLGPTDHPVYLLMDRAYEGG